jgi:hypothetical protein
LLKNNLKVTLIFLFLLAFSSCQKNKPIDKKDYKTYNFANQKWKSKSITHTIKSLSYTATEVPIKYFILKNSPHKNISEIDSIVDANNKERIIEVQFEHLDQVDILRKEYTNKSYEDAVKHMAFNIEKDFSIVTSSNDTIQCSGAHFERNFKVAPFKRALLYFNNIKPDDNIQLIYNDHLFGNGIIKFNFIEAPLKL